MAGEHRLTREERAKSEGEFYMYIIEFSARIRLGYVQIENANVTVVKGAPRREKYDYVYTFVCPECNQITTHSDPDCIITLVMSHLNGLCHEAEKREDDRRVAEKILKHRACPADWVEQRGKSKKQKTTGFYRCNYLPQKGDVCTLEINTPFIMLLHIISHFWPQQGKIPQAYLSPLNEILKCRRDEVLATEETCPQCTGHFRDLDSFKRHLPCPFDEQHPRPGHTARAERLCFICKDCQFLASTLDELLEHRRTCQECICHTCFEVSSRSMFRTHACFMYQCQFCTEMLEGRETLRHMCKEQGTELCHFEKVPLPGGQNRQNNLPSGDPGSQAQAVGPTVTTTASNWANPDYVDSVSEAFKSLSVHNSPPEGNQTVIERATTTPPTSKKVLKSPVLKPTFQAVSCPQTTVATLPPVCIGPTQTIVVSQPVTQPSITLTQNVQPSTTGMTPNVQTSTWTSTPISKNPPDVKRQIVRFFPQDPTTDVTVHQQSSDTLADIDWGALGARPKVSDPTQPSYVQPVSTAAPDVTQQFDPYFTQPPPSTIQVQPADPPPIYTHNRSQTPPRQTNIYTTGLSSVGGGGGGRAMDKLLGIHIDLILPSRTAKMLARWEDIPLGHIVWDIHLDITHQMTQLVTLGRHTAIPTGRDRALPPPPPGGGGQGNLKYECQWCGAVFYSLQELAEHEPECLYNPNNQGRPLICPLCQLTFQGLGALVQHLQGEHGTNEMRCVICGRSQFRHVDDFLTHISAHSNRRTNLLQILQQTPTTGLYANTTLPGYTPTRVSYSCKLCFANFSRDDAYFEHYSLYQCSKLSGLNGDINARSSPLAPPRRYNANCPHDRRKLEALKCLKDVPVMNRALLVDVLSALTYVQNVKMPTFEVVKSNIPKQTEINTVPELKISAHDPIESALTMETFLQRMTTFVNTVCVGEDMAIKILIMKVGTTMQHTIDQFLKKWETVAVGAPPYFLPCAFLETIYMCSSTPFMAKMQLQEMKMLPGEDPAQLMDRVTRLASLATKDYAQDLRCHYSEELAFSAFLAALPAKCRRLLQDEQTLRQRMGHEPLGGAGALQLLQRRISTDQVMQQDGHLAYYTPQIQQSAQVRPTNQGGQKPAGQGQATKPSRPATPRPQVVSWPPRAPAQPNKQQQGNHKGGQNANKDGQKGSYKELCKKAGVQFGQCIKCGNNNHKFKECKTFPGKLPSNICKFHKKYLHWNNKCPLNPEADADAKKKRCFTVLEVTEGGAEEGEGEGQTESVPDDSTVTSQDDSPHVSLHVRAKPAGPQKTTGSFKNQFEEWLDREDDGYL